MQKNKKWFSIVIWMWLTILILLMSYYLLSYIIPFWKNVKWIEQSSSAYYNAYAWIEQALLEVKSRPNLTDEFSKSMSSTSKTWIYYSTTSSWSRIPIPWKWNSEYDKNYNIISPYEPIQLEIWNWYYFNRLFFNWSTSTQIPLNNLEIFFRVPNFKNWTTLTLSWLSNYPVINWSISSEKDTLYASWNQLMSDWIFKSNESFTTWNGVFRLDKAWVNLPWWLTSIVWVNLSWSWIEAKTFYENNCKWTWSWCILKMSVINKLQLTDWTYIPYLEYIFDPHWAFIPGRHTTISTSWKSYWFQKNLEVQVPQQTTNQAFDFTIFQ